jgi:hypothetical protein
MPVAGDTPGRIPGLVVIDRVAERPGQHLRVVRTRGLHDRHEACLRFTDLHPAVIADHPVCTDEDCPPRADRDAGVLPAKRGDLLEVIVAVAPPGAAKRRVDSEERLTVGPEPANVHPKVAH